MAKIKLLAIGDHVTKTGFSRVLENILHYLPKKDYEISVLGVNYFGDPHDLPYKVYPASTEGDLYGFKRLEGLLNKIQPELIFILNDTWILNDYLKAFKNLYEGRANKPKIVVYTPVDALDHSPTWYTNFATADKIVTYTNFAKEVITKVLPNREILILPHGIDNTVFKNLPKSESKKVMYKTRPKFASEDSFIVLNANRNQPRKRLDITLRAFKMFAENKPANVGIYMHSGIRDAHIDTIELCAKLELHDRLIVTTLDTKPLQVPEKFLNTIYNATDVGINTSLGEGWGLCSMEHGVTGAPQIVPKNSANIELYEDCGLLVPTIMDWTLDNTNTTGSVVRPEDVAERLEWLYTDRQLYNSLSNKVINKFSLPEYQWSNISARWDTLFKEVLK